MSVFSVWDATLEKCHQLQNGCPTCHNHTWSMVILTTEWKSWRASLVTKSSWKCWHSGYTILFMVWKPEYLKQLQYSTSSPSISWLVAIVQTSLSPHTLPTLYKDGVQKSPWQWLEHSSWSGSQLCGLSSFLQMRTLHFFSTWSCCNSSTQNLGLGRKEQIKMCCSCVLMFLDGDVPIW